MMSSQAEALVGRRGLDARWAVTLKGGGEGGAGHAACVLCTMGMGHAHTTTHVAYASTRTRGLVCLRDHVGGYTVEGRRESMSVSLVSAVCFLLGDLAVAVGTSGTDARLTVWGCCTNFSPYLHFPFLRQACICERL